MPAYATRADFEAYVEGWVTDDAAALDRLLDRASTDVDAVLGPIPRLNLGTYAGRKIDPTSLRVWEAKALSDATCAQALWRWQQGEEAIATARPRSQVHGPDFREFYADAGFTGRYSPALARELEPLNHLRRLVARVL